MGFQEFINPNRFKKQVAIVTGAGSGIGKAIAIRLSLEGANVIVADKNVHSSNITAREIHENGGKVFVIQTDVSNSKDVQNMVNMVAERFNKINILINNAGISVTEDFFSMTEESWDEEIAVDLKGVMLCTKYVVPLMIKEGWGKIVNISSMCGLMGIGLKGVISPAYHAAKGGVTMLTKKLSGEFAPYKININTICPGYIVTAINEHIVETEIGKIIQGTIPWGRWGQTKDIASLTAFLASAEADFITGTNILVDGGTVSYLDVS